MVALEERPVTIADLKELEDRLSVHRTDIDRLKGWRKDLELDESFGRVHAGPQWLGGASIVDGTVEGNVFRATVTISNLFQTGESPEDRWELDPTGLRFYGTVLGVPDTKVFEVTSEGDITIGASAPNQATYDASTGTLSVPAAVISGLTISNVGTGRMGGTYRTSTNAGDFPRMDISTAGIRAYNSGGTQTFFADASNGDFSMVGTFTIASSLAASDRLQMTQAGIQLWKGGTREFYLQGSGATNAIEMILSGPSAGQYVGMNPSDGLWTGSSSFAGAATKFRVSNAGVLEATSATISGAITATSMTLSGALTIGASGTINLPSGGSITSAAMDFNTGTIAGFTVDGDVTVGGGGKIRFGTSGNDFLDNNILHFRVTGSEEAVIEWTDADDSNNPRGSVTGLASSTTAEAWLRSAYDSTIISAVGARASSTGPQMSLTNTYNGTYGAYQAFAATSSDASITLAVGASIFATSLLLEYTNRAAKFGGYIYPGTGSGTQAARHISDNGSEMLVTGGLRVTGDIWAEGTFRANSVSGSGATGAMPNPTKYVPIKNSAGTTYYIPAFSAFASWAA